jgi:photosystem II stability/assembly factor-like uncharacterized protein
MKQKIYTKTIILMISVSFFLLISCRKSEDFKPSPSVQKIDLPEQFTIKSITFIDDQTGFLCGGEKNSFGRIYRTDNGGSSWQKIYSSDSLCINDVTFLNNNIGYACGDSLLLKRSLDGGNTWELYNTNNRPDYFDIVSYNEVYASDTNYLILAGGDSGKGLVSFYSTSYGWDHVYFNVEVHSLTALSEYVFFFGADDFIILTEDEGFNFEDIEFSGQKIRKIISTPDKHILAINRIGTVHYSTDIGYNWRTVLSRRASVFCDIHYTEDLSVVCGMQGDVFFAYDNLNYWSKVYDVPRYNYISCFIKNNQEVFLGTDNGSLIILNRRRVP